MTMTTSQRIGRVLRNPELITARVKRTFLYAALQNPELLRSRVKEKFLYGGILKDAEAMHMVRAWSTGSLERKKLGSRLDSKTRIENSRLVIGSAGTDSSPLGYQVHARYPNPRDRNL
jgi:hypothetical protein